MCVPSQNLMQRIPANRDKKAVMKLKPVAKGIVVSQWKYKKLPTLTLGYTAIRGADTPKIDERNEAHLLQEGRDRKI